jgi:ketosteroid isomerase-like protein
MSYYAEDAMEMASNTPVIIGKEPIQKWYETWLKPEGVSMTFATEEVKVSTSLDMAVERGTYHFVQSNPSGQVDDTGKYVTGLEEGKRGVEGRDRHCDERLAVPGRRGSAGRRRQARQRGRGGLAAG